jgi:hypothetical protein
MLYQYKYNLVVILLLKILFPRRPKDLLVIQILQIWPKHMVHKLFPHNKIEMQKNNFFLVFPQLVQLVHHHVVGYFSKLAVAMDVLLAGGKSYESLVQSAVYAFEYNSSNLLDDVDMLMSLSLSDLCNHAHDIGHHADVHVGHKIHHLEHLQVHPHIHHKNNTRNYNE